MTFRILPLTIAASLLLAPPALAQAPSPKGPLNADALTRFPPPGRMVDIGGRRLHLDCKGSGRGPTVIIETGAVASSMYYRAARDAVARTSRACLYDRAGFGWSDPAPYPRTFADRADDLHALLGKAKIKGPYVLVGHSMGGLIVREFVARHPKGVVGVVLVESSEPEFNGQPANVARIKTTVQQMGMAVAGAEAGLNIPQLVVPNGPPDQAVSLRPSVFRAGQDDMATMADVTAQLAGLPTLGDLPLVVVRRGLQDPGMSAADSEGWKAAQERNARLSTRSVLMVAEKSGHNVHDKQPELYAEAVQRVLALRR